MDLFGDIAVTFNSVVLKSYHEILMGQITDEGVGSEAGGEGGTAQNSREK